MLCSVTSLRVNSLDSDIMAGEYLKEEPERQEVSLVDRIERPDLQRGKSVQVRCRNPNGSPVSSCVGEWLDADRECGAARFGDRLSFLREGV